MQGTLTASLFSFSRFPCRYAEHAFLTEQVDAHNIVPVWTTSDHHETMARTIRPKIHARPDFLGDIPELTPNSAGTALGKANDWKKAQASLDLDLTVPGKRGRGERFPYFLPDCLTVPFEVLCTLQDSVNIVSGRRLKRYGKDWKDEPGGKNMSLVRNNHTDALLPPKAPPPQRSATLTVFLVASPKHPPEVKWLKPGAKGASDNLQSFIDQRLKNFADLSNDPNENACSHISAHLNMGQLSAQAAVMRVKASRRHPDGVKAFVEQAAVRRELADNLCFYNSEIGVVLCKDTVHGLNSSVFCGGTMPKETLSFLGNVPKRWYRYHVIFRFQHVPCCCTSIAFSAVATVDAQIITTTSRGRPDGRAILSKSTPATSESGHTLFKSSKKPRLTKICGTPRSSSWYMRLAPTAVGFVSTYLA